MRNECASIIKQPEVVIKIGNVHISAISRQERKKEIKQENYLTKNHLQGKLNESEITYLIDSGANLSLVNSQIIDEAKLKI